MAGDTLPPRQEGPERTDDEPQLPDVPDPIGEKTDDVRQEVGEVIDGDVDLTLDDDDDDDDDEEEVDLSPVPADDEEETDIFESNLDEPELHNDDSEAGADSDSYPVFELTLEEEQEQELDDEEEQEQDDASEDDENEPTSEDEDTSDDQETADSGSDWQKDPKTAELIAELQSFEWGRKIWNEAAGFLAFDGGDYLDWLKSNKCPYSEDKEFVEAVKNVDRRAGGFLGVDKQPSREDVAAIQGAISSLIAALRRLDDYKPFSVDLVDDPEPGESEADEAGSAVIPLDGTETVSAPKTPTEMMQSILSVLEKFRKFRDGKKQKDGGYSYTVHEFVNLFDASLKDRVQEKWEIVRNLFLKLLSLRDGGAKLPNPDEVLSPPPATWSNLAGRVWKYATGTGNSAEQVKCIQEIATLLFDWTPQAKSGEKPKETADEEAPTTKKPTRPTPPRTEPEKTPGKKKPEKTPPAEDEILDAILVEETEGNTEEEQKSERIGGLQRHTRDSIAQVLEAAGFATAQGGDHDEAKRIEKLRAKKAKWARRRATPPQERGSRSTGSKKGGHANEEKKHDDHPAPAGGHAEEHHDEKKHDDHPGEHHEEHHP